MTNRFLAILPFLFIPFLFFAQNRDYFFKVPQTSSTDVPSWAQLMYQADPNVYEVDQAYTLFYRQHVFEKTVHTQNYKHWRRVITNYVNTAGLIRLDTRDVENDRVRQLKSVFPQNARAGQWTSLGPFETYEPQTQLPISWHSNVYSIDQSVSDPAILYCGTEGGGVFKTIDYGLNWSLVSADDPFSNGMTATGIHPQNPDQVIVAGNRRLYQTQDGGSTWDEISFLDESASEIKYHPVNTDTIWVASGAGLLKSFDGGENWATVFEETCWDVDFHPTDPSTLYALLSVSGENRSEFHRSIDNGETWELLTTGWYSPEIEGEASENGGKIAVTSADPDRVYACLIGGSKTGDDGWIGVYRSNNLGESWTNPNGQIGGPYTDVNSAHWNVAAYSDGYHQGFYNFDFEASQNNADRIWIGTIRLSESSNGGETFMAIGAANSNRLNRIHADIQSIHVQGDDIWVASDGGINYSTDELQSHESRKNGIIGADFWGFGSGWNEDVLVGGKYHNGNSARHENYPEGVYLNIGGVEESTGYVNPLENRKVYHNQYWGGGTRAQLLPEDLTGAVLDLPYISLIPNENYVESSSSGLYFDPRYSEHIYAGLEGGIWKSVNGGALFEQLHNFSSTPDNEGEVYEIDISRENPDVIYCVYRDGDGYWDPCVIQKSIDGGESWQQTSNISANRWRLNISTNPQNSDEIWVAASSGANGQKVFRSIDSGQTWENKTTATLDEQRPKDLFFQGGTTSSVYLATNNGVFLWDEASADWLNYSDGLPFVTSSLKFAPFYRDEKIRLSTYGRGIWESPLAGPSAPIAQPMTSNDQIYCARDTVLFDSYSIVAETGTSWAWEFTPAPLYVSDLTARNPKVVFGNAGTYDVALTITNNDGIADTKMETEMVTVSNYCSPDIVPGQALRVETDGDWGQTDALGIETNTLTISAWIKPMGIQPEYGGIVMNDGTAAGFNFQANNKLGYHWPGGAWWWESGLDVPENEWSHVAMVASPEGMTLYVNGEASFHETALDSVSLGSLKFGSYLGWGGRNLDAFIDEVCIWNRSLSIEEIRLSRHLTKNNIAAADESLIAYYQFNEPEGRVNDRVGHAHASLAGNAHREVSSAPVGDGVSKKIVLDADPSIVDFEEVGVMLDLSDSGADGEIVATRLSLLPHNLIIEDASPEEYWILNHYGTIPGFEFPTFSITPTANDPGYSFFALFNRAENDDEDTWTDCHVEAATALQGNTVTFNADCPTISFGQFYLWPYEIVDTDEELISSPVKVYPNPSIKNGQITISPAPTKPVRMKIFSMEGKLIQDQFIDTSGTVSLGDLAAGTYIFQLKGDDFIRSGKLVVQ